MVDEEVDRRLSHTSFRRVDLRAVEYKPTWRSRTDEEFIQRRHALKRYYPFLSIALSCSCTTDRPGGLDLA